MLPLGFQQGSQLLIGFPDSSLGLQLLDLCLMDGLGGKEHMGQMPFRVTVTLNEGALCPVRPLSLLRVQKHRAQVLPGNDPLIPQPLLQRGQIHKSQHFLRKFRRHHIAAEVVQPVLGVARGADLRLYLRQRSQLRKPSRRHINVIYGGIDLAQRMDDLPSVNGRILCHFVHNAARQSQNPVILL